MYMYKCDGMVKMPSGFQRHKTKWMVKIISGPQRGMFALFDTEPLARMEAFYQSDACDVCTSIYPPVYADD